MKTGPNITNATLTEVWPLHSWSNILKINEKIDSTLGKQSSFVEPNSWKILRTLPNTMADFLNVKTVGALKLSTVFTWKVSGFVRVLYKPVLIWYMKRSSFWSGWEKRCLPIKQNCDPKYVVFLYITLLWSCYNINYYLILPSISLIKKTFFVACFYASRVKLEVQSLCGAIPFYSAGFRTFQAVLDWKFLPNQLQV